MRILLLLLFIATPFFISAEVNQQPVTRSIQDIIDEVNGGIDDVNCGIGALAQNAVDIINEDIIDELNDIISETLESFDLGCIEEILDSGFFEIFDIDFEMPGFCEIVSDQINNSQNDPLFKTSKGKEFDRIIKRNIEKKNQFKSEVVDW